MTSALLNPETLAASPSAVAPDSTSREALASFEALHTLYQPRIFRFLLASTRDRDLAQSLTQDTFLRAWSARSTFRGDCSPATWLTRIALNLLRDHTRTGRFRFWRRAAQSSMDASALTAHLAHPASSGESRLIAEQQLALIWKTVATLSDRQRTIFLLRFLEELPLPEIAHITGLPLPTVKTHLYRALTAVRALHPAASKDPSR